MKTILAATVAAVLATGSAAASTPPAVASPAGSVFAELADLGYDLGKFRPDYAGRFPYR